MKKLILCAVLAITGLTASARDFEAGGLWYTVLDEVQKTCKTKDGDDFSAGAPAKSFSGELRIPGTVSDGTATYTVVEIGARSFQNCRFTNTRLVHGEIPASVKTIGFSAFQQTNIECLMIPEGVETIGSYAFYIDSKDKSLKYVFLPQSVKNTWFLDEVFNIKSAYLIVAPSRFVCSGSNPAPYTVQHYPDDAKWDGDCLYTEDASGGRTLHFVSWATSGTLRLPASYKAVEGKYMAYENLSTILPPAIAFDCGTQGSIGHTAAHCTGKWYPGYRQFNSYGSDVIYYSDDAVIDEYGIYDEINIKQILLNKILPETDLSGINVRYLTEIPDRKMKALIFTIREMPERYTVKDDTEALYFTLSNHENTTAIQLPASLTFIYYSLNDLPKLSECRLSSGLTTIIASFNNLRSLANISLPGSLKYIYSGFTECALEAISIPDNVAMVSGFSDNHILTSNGDEYKPEYTKSPTLKNVTFGRGIRLISGFDRLACTEITIPEGADTIIAAFNACPELKKVSLPSTLQYVSNSFTANTVLEFLEIPASVKTFLWQLNGKYPKAMRFNAPTPPDYFDSDGISRTTDYDGICIVPDGALMTYAESPVFADMALETVSGLAPGHLDDGVFRYIAYPDNKQAVVRDLADKSNASRLSIPNKIPVEDASGTVFYPVKGIWHSAFASNTNLRQIILPAQLEFIGSKAFEQCTALEDIKFPQSLARIGLQAFRSCAALKSIDFYDNLNMLGAGAFLDCTGLEKVSFLDGLQYIDAFPGCTNLKEVSLPASLKIIGVSAFLNCKSLVHINLPEGIEELDYRCFANCKSLKEITLPASLMVLRSQAFAGCDSMESITIADAEQPLVPVYGRTYNPEYNAPWFRYGVFNGVRPKELYIGRPTEISEFHQDEEADDYDPSATLSSRPMAGRICTLDSLRSVEFGNLVTAIADYAFNVPKLTNVKFGANLEVIGSYAFSYGNLTELVLPSKVTEIRPYAFYGNNLAKATIGAGIEQIGKYAFYGSNNNLENVYITALNPPMAFDNTFGWYGGTLYVTPGCRDSYENNPNCWYRFSNHDLIEAEKITLDTYTFDAGAGKSIKLSASITPADATLQTILWESSDPSVATVDADGLVTFVGVSDSGSKAAPAKKRAETKGTVEIRAYTLYANSPVATCKINYTLSGIESIETDNAADGHGMGVNPSEPFKVFSIQGYDVTPGYGHLAPGIYIVKQDGQSHKIVVR